MSVLVKHVQLALSLLLASILRSGNDISLVGSAFRYLSPSAVPLRSDFGMSVAVSSSDSQNRRSNAGMYCIIFPS